MEQVKSFEENLRRLEEIVRTMERGEVPLDQSLTLFQEGTALLQVCGEMLDEAELKVKQLVPDENGEPVQIDFQE